MDNNYLANESKCPCCAKHGWGWFRKGKRYATNKGVKLLICEACYRLYRPYHSWCIGQFDRPHPVDAEITVLTAPMPGGNVPMAPVPAGIGGAAGKSNGVIS